MLLGIPLSLLSLAVGAFGIGLTEFLIMGLLPEVAAGMDVTIPQAGYFISAYALGVVVGAPLLSIMGRSLPPKKKLIVLMIVFTVFNGLSAIVPGPYTLLFFRFLSGLPHGAFFGVGGIVATRIAPPGKSASSIALMMAGLTICNVIGVPIATWVGQATNWRIAFALVSLVGIATLASIATWVPQLEGDPKRELSHEFRIFKNPILWYLIVFASIGFGGFFAWFSYITPILTNLTQVPLKNVPYVLSLAGLGMTFGNWLGGKLGDRIPPINMAIYLSATTVLVLILNSLFATQPWAIYILTFLTGASAISMSVPIQLLLIQASKESPFLGASIGHGAFNMGNSLGAFLGGIPLAAGFGFVSPWWTGAGLTTIGVLIVWRLKSVAPAEYKGMSLVGQAHP